MTHQEPDRGRDAADFTNGESLVTDERVSVRLCSIIESHGVHVSDGLRDFVADYVHDEPRAARGLLLRYLCYALHRHDLVYRPDGLAVVPGDWPGAAAPGGRPRGADQEAVTC